MRTTAKHFEEFKRYHGEYMTRYGLLQWRVEYAHESLESSYAETEFRFKAKIAKVSLATNWTKTRPLNSAELKILAKHEANHMLVYGLYWHATARYISPDTLEEAEEAIVRTLDVLISD